MKGRSKYWTRERVLETLRDLDAKGHALNYQSLQKSGWRGLLGGAKENYNGLNHALQAAGIDPTLHVLRGASKGATRCGVEEARIDHQRIARIRAGERLVLPNGRRPVLTPLALDLIAARDMAEKLCPTSDRV
jgi:hypothetical protein